jgi:hypothetical protein
MARPERQVEDLSRTVTATTAAPVPLLNRSDRTFGSPGIEAGGRLVLVGSGTIRYTLTDATGKILADESDADVTASKSYDPTAAGVKGPLSWNVTTYTGFTSATLHWSVRK